MKTPHLALSSNEGFLIRRYRSVYLLKVFFVGFCFYKGFKEIKEQ